MKTRTSICELCEFNDRFYFLDAKIMQVQPFATSVFHKSAFTGVFANFDNFVYENDKLSE